MDIMERRYRKNPELPSREIAQEIILVPLRKKLADVNAIYLLQNDVSLRIWELIDGQKQVGEIAEIISREYDVTPAEAKEDIAEFFEELERIGGIIEPIDKGEGSAE